MEAKPSTNITKRLHFFMDVLGVNAARVSTTTCSNNTAERQYLVKHPHPETKGKDTSTVNIDDETIGTINDTEAKTGNQNLSSLYGCSWGQRRTDFNNHVQHQFPRTSRTCSTRTSRSQDKEEII